MMKGPGLGERGGAMMQLDRFRDLLDANGADPCRWPPADAAAAVDLLARSAEARAALAGARDLDALLDGLPAVQPSPMLRASVLAIPVDHPRPARPRPRFSLATWLAQVSLGRRLVAGAVMATMLGVVIGVGLGLDTSGMSGGGMSGGGMSGGSELAVNLTASLAPDTGAYQ